MTKRRLFAVILGLMLLSLCCALWFYSAAPRYTPAGNARFVQAGPGGRV